ncbi:MAG: hypothetical protein EOP07_12560 [Proteobacteria bacterium]|nr:MAG: hypothetical protein EOP07_12560 [Pseudomonadota bacterium]
MKLFAILPLSFLFVTNMAFAAKVSAKKDGTQIISEPKKEAEAASGIQSALHDAAMKARNSTEGGETTRARSAVMGVRGLNENNELAEVGSLRPDLRAVYHMEDRALNNKRVDRLEALVLKEVENTAIGQTKK